MSEILLIYHFLDYFIAYFRQYDKIQNGKLDVNGILRG